MPLGELGGQLALYFDGDLDAGLAFGRQVAGRITSVEQVADILRTMVADAEAILHATAGRFT